VKLAALEWEHDWLFPVFKRLGRNGRTAGSTEKLSVGIEFAVATMNI
jgi:hypothetical protein